MIKAWLTNDKRKSGLLGRLFKINTVWGDEQYNSFIHDSSVTGLPDSNNIVRTPMLTTFRLWGRRYLHVFWRRDMDPDWHDHMWDFHTFPIWPPGGYQEEKLVRAPTDAGVFRFFVLIETVPARTWTFRNAEHCHKIINTVSRRWPLITYVVKEEKRREWGFWVFREGCWFWRDWKDYVYWDGKTRPPNEHEKQGGAP